MNPKFDAVRFYLAQTAGDGLFVRDIVRNICSFGSPAAAELYTNPFLCKNEHRYVLRRVVANMDTVLGVDNWWYYATPDGVVELAKALRGEPYTPVEVYDKKRIRAYLSGLRCKYIFQEG